MNITAVPLLKGAVDRRANRWSEDEVSPEDQLRCRENRTGGSKQVGAMIRRNYFFVSFLLGSLFLAGTTAMACVIVGRCAINPAAQ